MSDNAYDSRRNDEALLDGFYAGDVKAFEELTRQNEPWLLTLAEHRLRRMGVRDPHNAAMDVVQDTIVNVLKSKNRKSRWRASRGPVKPWLNRVLRNNVINLARKRFPTPATDLERKAPGGGDAEYGVFEVRDARACSPFDNSVSSERKEMIRRRCTQLEEPLRSIMYLKYWKGLPQRRIAKKLGMTDLQVCQGVKRAYRILRNALMEGAIG